MDFENVTVVALAHNGERCIRRTVDSLVAQTRPPDRIVVADMGSSDGTYRVLCDMLGLEPIEHEGKRALPPKGEGRREYGRSFDWFRLLGGPMHDSNCLVRKAAMEQAGAAFDPQLHHAVFYELFLRLARVGIIYHLPESLHFRPEKKVKHTEAVRQEIIHVRQAVLKGAG